jgi:hypothetical protein
MCRGGEADGQQIIVVHLFRELGFERTTRETRIS